MCVMYIAMIVVKPQHLAMSIALFVIKLAILVAKGPILIV